MYKVLIVDDNYFNRQLIVETLREVAKCDQASNGKEAFKIFNKTYETKEYDLYLVDIAMPEIDGVKLISLIQEVEDFNKIPLDSRLPIIVVTAHEERLQEVFNLGYHDYILKPIDPDVLEQRIYEKLSNSRYRHD